MGFYKDDKGLQVCEMGTGDVSVSGIHTPDKMYHGIGFGELEPGEINREIDGMSGKFDYETRVKFKIMFTKIESIDVIMDRLKLIKKEMKAKLRIAKT